MNISDLKLAADGCGELARGFKKLKAFLSSESVLSLWGQKNPQQKETAVSDSDSDSADSQSTPTSLIRTNAKAIEKWALSRDAGWGPTHSEQLAHVMLGERWRGDNYKNYWRYVGPEAETRADLCARTSWDTVSYRTILKLYDVYGHRLEDIKCYLAEQRAGKTGVWEKVHRCKRKRIQHVMESTPIPMIEFTRIMKDNHKDLPPLRGGIKVV